MTINERVKYLRKEYLNLTQQDFADQLILGRATIAQIESGKINLTERNIGAICETFGVSENWLRTGEGEMLNTHSDDVKLAQQLGQIVSDRYPHKKKLIEAILNMSDEEVRSFTELLSKLV